MIGSQSLVLRANRKGWINSSGVFAGQNIGLVTLYALRPTVLRSRQARLNADRGPQLKIKCVPVPANVRDRLATSAIRQFKLARNIDRSGFANQAEISMMLKTVLERGNGHCARARA
jgi:hypothetical protein